jgi:hypothetical protein
VLLLAKLRGEHECYCWQNSEVSMSVAVGYTQREVSMSVTVGKTQR